MTAAGDKPEVFTHEPPGVAERYSAWAAGRTDEDFGFMVGSVGWNCSDRIAGSLYDLHIMAEHALDRTRRFREVKDWGYTLAASFARGAHLQYSLAWGRQAARDGLVLALWPDDGRTELGLTTCEQRSAQFGVGRNKYGRVRAHVRAEAKALIAEFEGFLQDAVLANR